MSEKICIIIPCYNEETRLSVNDFQDFCNQNSHISFVFVNDGSKDNTLAVLNKMKDGYEENISVVDLERNSGKAEAVRRGIQYSFVWNKFDYVAYFDADLATPLEEIHHLYDQMKQSEKREVSFGSRMKRIGANCERKATRHYFGRVFATSASLILRLAVYDTQCGAKLFSNSIAKEVFDQPFISSWLFDVEIFARIIIKRGYQSINSIMIEVPVNTWIEMGESKLRFSHLLKVPFELIAIRQKYKLYKISKKN